MLTFTTLMSASTRAGQWRLAISAFQKMEDRGLQVPSCVVARRDYCTALLAAVLQLAVS